MRGSSSKYVQDELKALKELVGGEKDQDDVNQNGPVSWQDFSK